jgi:hypothetical protein
MEKVAGKEALRGSTYVDPPCRITFGLISNGACVVRRHLALLGLFLYL